jgi:hypothetical protein
MDMSCVLGQRVERHDMPRRIHLLLLFTTLGVLSGLPARISLGCQYNVRETGFVDLGTERYFLFCYVSRNTPRDVVTAFEQVSEKALRDSGVISQVIHVDGPDNYPALKYLDRAHVSSLPRVVLVSPGEQSRVIPVQTRAETFRPALPAILREIIDSPLRQAIVHQLARTYGVVLLIEGVDAEANRMASKAAETAIKAIERQMKFMPKPIAREPVLVTLKRDSFSREATLLWSLGIREESLGEPHVAVLYGRARWIGPLLKGAQITEKTLHNILSAVGADCECGIDPRLIRGTALPVKWDRDAQATAAAELGFDPENPMVITEVSQIMKMRVSLYPWTLSARENKAGSAGDLPIPFVEDNVPSKSAAGLPVRASLLYTIAAVAGLVLMAGVVMVLKAARRKS